MLHVCEGHSTAQIVLLATLPADSDYLDIPSTNHHQVLQNLRIGRQWIVRTKYGKIDAWSLYPRKDQGMCDAFCVTLVHSTSMGGIIITRAIGIEVAWKLNSTVAI